MKANQLRRYGFIIISVVSLPTLTIWAIWAISVGKVNIFLFLLLPMLGFEVVQLVRIFRTGMTYKKWINSEIKYTMMVFALFISLPNLLRISLSLNISIAKYFSIISLTCLSIAIFALIAKIILHRNNFHTSSNNKKISEIIEVLEKKSIPYKIKRTDKKFEIISKKKDKKIYLPKYECSIFKTKDRTVIKPNSRLGQKNVYDIIDTLEQ